MSDRLCPKCDNRLRSNNTRGVCNSCWKKGERLDGDAKVVDRLELDAPPRAKARKGSSSVERMRLVADAIGLDGAQLQEDFATAWLADLAAKAVADEP